MRSIAVYHPVAFGVLYDPPDAAGLADAAPVGPLLQVHAGGSAGWLEELVDDWSGPGAWLALPEATRASFLAVGRKVFLEVDSLLGERDALLSATLHDVKGAGHMGPITHADVVNELVARQIAASSASSASSGTAKV